MSPTELLAILRRAKYMVEATVHADGRPQAAVIGVAVTDALELVFDTTTSSRKYGNLIRDPRCAIVMFDDELTVQLEGRADVPTGDELERVREAYFEVFPDGRDRARELGDIVWVRVRPTWIRLSDFSVDPPRIEEHVP